MEAFRYAILAGLSAFLPRMAVKCPIEPCRPSDVNASACRTLVSIQVAKKSVIAKFWSFKLNPGPLSCLSVLRLGHASLSRKLLMSECLATWANGSVLQHRYVYHVWNV